MSSSQQAKAPLFSGLFRVRKSQDCPDRAEKPKHAGTALEMSLQFQITDILKRDVLQPSGQLCNQNTCPAGDVTALFHILIVCLIALYYNSLSGFEWI